LRSGLLRDATELSFGVHESSARNAVRIGSSSISVLDTGLFAKISVRNVLTGLGGASDWGDRGGKTCYPNQGSFKNDRRRGDALRRTGIAATIQRNCLQGIDFATRKKCAECFGARCYHEGCFVAAIRQDRWPLFYFRRAACIPCRGGE
jgi:hypothetical protein